MYGSSSFEYCYCSPIVISFCVSLCIKQYWLYFKYQQLEAIQTLFLRIWNIILKNRVTMKNS